MHEKNATSIETKQSETEKEACWMVKNEIAFVGWVIALPFFQFEPFNQIKSFTPFSFTYFIFLKTLIIFFFFKKNPNNLKFGSNGNKV